MTGQTSQRPDTNKRNDNSCVFPEHLNVHVASYHSANAKPNPGRGKALFPIHYLFALLLYPEHSGKRQAG